LNAVDFSPNYGSIAELFALEGEEGAEGIYPGGDVTRFRYTSAVPEPSSWSLLLLGSLGLALFRRRNKI